jgi:hypothetical protein
MNRNSETLNSKSQTLKRGGHALTTPHKGNACFKAGSLVSSVSCIGFRVQDAWFRLQVQGAWFRVSVLTVLHTGNAWLQVWNLGLRVSELRFRVWGLRSGVQSLGFRDYGFGFGV